MEQILKRLKDEYVQDVLSILFPKAAQEGLFSYGTAIGEELFTLELRPSYLTDLCDEFRVEGTRFVHFTSLRTLFSILNERAVRMYDLTHMNDPNEVAFYIKHLGVDIQAIDPSNSYESLKHELAGLGSDGDESVRQKIYALEQRIRRYERFEARRRSTMILSMCPPEVLDLESENTLNLWRLYGDEGKGCAIEFDFGVEENGRLGGFGYMLGNVVYEHTDTDRADRFRNAHVAFEKRRGKVHVEKVLGVPACLYKHPFFRIEKDVRLLSWGGRYQPTDTISADPNVRFDYNARGDMVRYHHLPLFAKEGLQVEIKRIELGFRVDTDAAKQLKKDINGLLSRWEGEITRTIDVKVDRSGLGKVFQ